MHLIWFEVIIVLKGMFKVELALLFALKWQILPAKLFGGFLGNFGACPIFYEVFLPTTQKSVAKLLYAVAKCHNQLLHSKLLVNYFQAINKTYFDQLWVHAAPQS